jgi:hypothetical protein
MLSNQAHSAFPATALPHFGPHIPLPKHIVAPERLFRVVKNHIQAKADGEVEQ